jgi:hypothetical protein
MSNTRKRGLHEFFISTEPENVNETAREATGPIIEYFPDSEAEHRTSVQTTIPVTTIPVTICTLTGARHQIQVDPSNLLKCTAELAQFPCVIPSGNTKHHQRIQAELRDNTIAGRLASNLLSTQPWTVEFVWAIVHEYLRFLELKMEEDKQNVIRLSPSPLIDQVWHAHILDTQHYAADCHQMYATHFPRKVSQMVHHSPLGMLDGEKVLQERREAAKKAYQLRFGTTPSEDYWGAKAEPEINYHTCTCLNCVAALRMKTGPRQIQMIFRGKRIGPGMRFSDLQVPLEHMVFQVLPLLTGC